jgi:hypothetical protein
MHKYEENYGRKRRLWMMINWNSPVLVDGNFLVVCGTCDANADCGIGVLRPHLRAKAMRVYYGHCWRASHFQINAD